MPNYSKWTKLRSLLSDDMAVGLQRDGVVRGIRCWRWRCNHSRSANTWASMDAAGPFWAAASIHPSTNYSVRDFAYRKARFTRAIAQRSAEAVFNTMIRR